MKDKILVINFFDENEMKWYQKEDSAYNQLKERKETFHEHAVKGPSWFLHELGKQVPKPIFGNGLKLEDYFEEPVQLEPLVQIEKFKEFEEFEKYQNSVPFLEVKE
ncbi:hypothetical protein [Oceanirhabdus seepicola]|uniref:Uncharacterized protein n=1 Tax=Oceanirhabdus seepicola TaxID=2828781 RepID=A0A9J6PDL9_9CLOT|nr:hypothetical protein [Oceanirhabdus seepicola]MCM1992829.1 hypothetical protein [Oceanirhabdus seepicola]